MLGCCSKTQKQKSALDFILSWEEFCFKAKKPECELFGYATFISFTLICLQLTCIIWSLSNSKSVEHAEIIWSKGWQTASWGPNLAHTLVLHSPWAKYVFSTIFRRLWKRTRICDSYYIWPVKLKYLLSCPWKKSFSTSAN